MEHRRNIGQSAIPLAALRAADERTVFAALARARPGTLTGACELRAFYNAMIDEICHAAR